MGWIIRDYKCECGHDWEDMVRSDQQLQVCPSCGKQVEPALSAPGLATYSIMDRDAKAAHLRKRSRDHTIAQLKKDPTSMKQSRHIVGKKK